MKGLNVWNKDICVGSCNPDCDPVRHSTPLTLHILNHADHSLESCTVDNLPVIGHDLPPLPQSQGLLYLERYFLLFCSLRTGVSGACRRVVPGL